MSSRPISLITGAGRGIGRGIALELAKLGHSIIVNYAENAQAAEECLAEIHALGGDGITVQADISLADDRERLVETTLAAYGALDLLVNNAGVAPNLRADLLDASERSYDRVMSVNLKGPFFQTQRVARQMILQVESDRIKASGRPRIVTVSSISAYTASINRGDYCVSKSGLSMMTRLFALRLAEFGINVYEVRPGVISTDMTARVREKYDKMIAEGVWPIPRWGEPSDIGLAVAAIARGDFPFSTGEVINVDGGFHLRSL